MAEEGVTEASTVDGIQENEASDEEFQSPSNSPPSATSSSDIKVSCPTNSIAEVMNSSRVVEDVLCSYMHVCVRGHVLA